MAIKTTVACCIAGAAIGLWSVSALAVAPPPVPATLTQQGRILDKTGAPVSSKVQFVFTVYDDPTASATADVLWTETQNITLDDGYFSAQLGSATPIPAGVFDGSVRYLGVTVGADDEMTPRQAITSVPYAILAGNAAVAAVATNMAFSGLTGIPAVCPAGQFLKGYGADGSSNCAAPAAVSLNCTVYFSAAVNGSAASQGCGAGEVITGGGCLSNVGLTSSYQDVCVSGAGAGVPSAVAPADVAPAAATVISTIPIATITATYIDPCIYHSGIWTCDTVSAATGLRAYANCCKVQ